MEDTIKLAKKQEEFLSLIEEGKNVFLTGKAGTGKSFVVKLAIEKLKSLDKKFVVVAPTGIAANNVGGQTIHSLFSINPFGVSDFDSCNFVKGKKRQLLKEIDTIFIDEISMLRPDTLDAINWTLLKNGCGGLEERQIIFIGDLKQLPSPIDDNTRSVLYRKYNGEEFYHSIIYRKLSVIDIELDEVHRQKDEEFIENLNIIRDGGKSEYFKRFVSEEPSGVILAPHNATVDYYNIKGLESQHGEEFVFDAVLDGNAKMSEFNLEAKIRVKNGCKIMYLLNSKNNNLFNGTIGIFVSHEGCHYIRVGDVDYALSQETISKKEFVFDEEKNDIVLKETGSITQYPFKLAYALSIHKSQGLTFDEITVDLKRPCFQKGQMYVALSRVKTPEGLKILI